MRVLLVVVLSLVVGGSLGAMTAYRTVGPERTGSDIAAMRSDGQPSDEKYPKFKVDSATHNFGSMQRGTTRKHAFQVTNVGDKPLTLAVLSTTCKCTVGEADDQQVAPGETTSVTLSWVAKTVAGPFQQTATLETNDPRASRVELTVEGQVTDLSGVEPKEWYFTGLRLGEGRTESVYVMAYEQDDMQIESAEMEHEDARDEYEVSYAKVEKSELPDPKATAGYRVDLTPKDNLPLGPIQDWVLLKTNIEGAEEIRVPVFGKVIGDIEIHGPSQWNAVTGNVHFGEVQSDKGAEIKLFLNVAGEHAKGVEFEVVETDPEQLEVEIGEPKQLRDDLTHVPLVVRIPEGLPPAIRNGTGLGEAGRVVLKSNHPVNSEISFGVTFVIKGQRITK